MEKNKKIALIIASIIAVVLIAGVLVFYCFFYNKSESDRGNDVIDQNNPAAIYENSINQNNPSKEEDISKGELVDANINEQLSAKIQGYANSLGNITVNGIKVYKNNGGSVAGLVNQESTYNNVQTIDNNASSNVVNNQTDNQANNPQNNANNPNKNVNIILDLTLEPSSNNMETTRQELETKANNLAIAIATEKPTIQTAIVNFSVNNNPNAKASFTFERSGSNMFLQEFTMSSEFN